MGLKEGLNNVATNAERFFIGNSWAMEMSTFLDRLWYYRTTGRWPQGSDPFFEAIVAQDDIN